MASWSRDCLVGSGDLGVKDGSVRHQTRIGIDDQQGAGSLARSLGMEARVHAVLGGRSRYWTFAGRLWASSGCSSQIPFGRARLDASAVPLE